MTDTPISGAKALINCLKNEGVDTIFGYPGGVLLPLYDELYDSDINHILVRHEQCAAHAADGYARATGRVGVCLATSGPGATNLVTGIANAYMDSVPIVAITGQVPTPMIGNDAFQEADITGITLPITKHNYLVRDVEDLPRVVKEAFCIASTGRPGPVLIDLPKDITTDEFECIYPDKTYLRGYQPDVGIDEDAVKRAASMILDSERPIIYAGGGAIISDSSSELLRLAETIQAPVTTTLLGIGAFPQSNPLSLRMLGMHGTKYANYAVQESDLLIAVGARFDDRVTGKIDAFAPHAKVIHIDIDPAEIGKNVRVDLPVIGDAKAILQSLNSRLQKMQTRSDVWLGKIVAWKKKHPLSYEQSDEVIKPQYVIQEIHRACPDAIIVTEVGQNQMWAAQYFQFENPRTFITSGGLGTMGYGFPAAIGAKVGCPDRTVIDIAGDGSFQMTSQELATASKSNIKVIVAILNNSYLGMVRQWQELFFDERYSYTDISQSVDFVKLAEAYNLVGIRAEKPSEVPAAISEALSADRTVVIDFVVDPMENVFPMVPAGAAINEIIGPEVIA
ncbi:MAG: acetolactate synthase large subunit [Candidatus Methanogaster sp.]|nr:MAG: acetolactate synthase large subunit [ANME-2 cluster archaeon]